MSQSPESKFAKISERMFYFAQMDIKTLRARYRNVNEDIPYGIVATASRDVIIRGLACHEFGFEFGFDVVDDYIKMTKIWDQTYPLLIGLDHRCPELE